MANILFSVTDAPGGGGQMSDAFVPGAWVRHPDRPDWGLGQIQSVVGQRVTVNFEHAGKLSINAAAIQLQPADPDPDRR
jgi:hypothetical protein